MPIKRLSVVSIPVKDQQLAKQFYTEVLGFIVIRDNPMGPAQRWVELAPEPGETTITLVTWFPTMQPGGVTGLVLEADDLDDTMEQLRERGLALEAAQSAPWGRFTTFSDLDGNGWVLQESAPEMPGT